MTLNESSNPEGQRAHDRTYLTTLQQGDVIQNGELWPLSDSMPRQNVEYAFNLLTGFYPDVEFSYEEADLNPTVYASKGTFGSRRVQINGGLERQKVLKVDGIVMAISWGIACLYAGDPENKQGYAAMGWADYYAFGMISRKVWLSNYVTNGLAALDQWKAIFALVAPDHAQGNPEDPINDPSLACRTEAAGSGLVGGALPECVGGEPRE